MRIKRPLIWVLGGWILGEIVAAGLGWQMTSASGLNLVMESRETLPVTVTGRVSRVAESASGIQITLTENQVLWNETILDTRNLLLREKANTFSPSFSSLCPGTWIRAEGELSAFPDAGNPGEFDQRKYYQQMGVDYRLDTAAWSCLQEANGAAAFSWRLRNQLKDSIVAVTHSEEAAGVFRALILGDRSGLEQETKDLYEVGGITHILSISALHLTLIGNTLQKILRRLHLPRSAASIICASFLGWYVWLIGGSASSRRAFLMFCVMLLAPFAGRTYDMLSALGLAGLVLLAGQPSLAFQAGFQLSFAAVAGIGILYPLTEKPSETQKKEERGKKKEQSSADGGTRGSGAALLTVHPACDAAGSGVELSCDFSLRADPESGGDPTHGSAYGMRTHGCDCRPGISGDGRHLRSGRRGNPFAVPETLRSRFGASGQPDCDRKAAHLADDPLSDCDNCIHHCNNGSQRTAERNKR